MCVCICAFIGLHVWGCTCVYKYKYTYKYCAVFRKRNIMLTDMQMNGRMPTSLVESIFYVYWFVVSWVVWLWMWVIFHRPLRKSFEESLSAVDDQKNILEHVLGRAWFSLLLHDASCQLLLCTRYKKTKTKRRHCHAIEFCVSHKLQMPHWDHL